jgi:DNA-binding protein YbaB
MNICSIGINFAEEVTPIDYNTSRTILEFDAVFIDSNGIENNGQNPNAINFRRSDFLEFLALGRTIVVFTASLNLETYIPVQSLGLKSISGMRVDFKGPDHLKIFWESVQEDMQFLAYFEKNPGQPFLFVPATKKAVGTLIKSERGNLLFIPWLKLDRRYPSTYHQQCKRFLTAFKKLNDHLVPKKATVSLPAWSNHYGWERERKLRETLVSLQKQADEFSKQISTKTVELEIEDKLKVLFTSKGEVLVDVVIDVFQELGAKANPGEPGRDDVIVEFEGKHAVVEVKGKKSSAAESDAAQLEKWVAGFKEEKGADPKGILLIDAYCETPLAERTEPAFPHQMLKYSTQREHCLITTTQFLGLLLEARANPEKRIDLVNSLFSTVGVFQQFSDWQKFLTAPAKTK